MTIRTILTIAAVAAPLAAFATAAAAMSWPTDSTIDTSKGQVAIHAIHHAALTLTWNGVEILVDPAPLPVDAKGTAATADFTALPPPDVILYTHDHADHFNLEVLRAVAGKATIVAPKEVADKLPDALKGQAKVLANGDKAEVAGIPIAAVAMYNTTPERTKFHPKGGGNGYVLTLGDKHIYIAGDTEETPEMDALAGIDAAFLPMDGTYTMDIEHAAKAVKDFKPKVVFPYHYTDSDVVKFKKLVGDAAEVRLLKWY